MLPNNISHIADITHIQWETGYCCVRTKRVVCRVQTVFMCRLRIIVDIMCKAVKMWMSFSRSVWHVYTIRYTHLIQHIQSDKSERNGDKSTLSSRYKHHCIGIYAYECMWEKSNRQNNIPFTSTVSQFRVVDKRTFSQSICTQRNTLEKREYSTNCIQKIQHFLFGFFSFFFCFHFSIGIT